MEGSGEPGRGAAGAGPSHRQDTGRPRSSQACRIAGNAQTIAVKGEVVAARAPWRGPSRTREGGPEAEPRHRKSVRQVHGGTSPPGRPRTPGRSPGPSRSPSGTSRKPRRARTMSRQPWGAASSEEGGGGGRDSAGYLRTDSGPSTPHRDLPAVAPPFEAAGNQPSRRAVTVDRAHCLPGLAFVRPGPSSSAKPLGSPPWAASGTRLMRL